MWYILTFIIGIIIGVAGTVVLACLAAAGDADRREDTPKTYYFPKDCPNHEQCDDCPEYCAREDDP